MQERVGIFVVGVQKGGTTSLHEYFVRHPALAAPRVKELHFFSKEKHNWRKPNYEGYHNWFPKNKDGLRFDVTPIYMFSPFALGRIANYNPEAKLIFLLRDPFDRAYSQWCMEYSRGHEPLLFAEAIRTGRDRLIDKAIGSPEWRRFSYIERGYYAGQVRRALDLFPRQNILFLRSEDLLKNHNETLASIADFLRIPAFSVSKSIEVHKRQKIEFPSEKTEEDRKMVADLLAEEMEDFSTLTGVDTARWAVMRRAPQTAPALG